MKFFKQVFYRLFNNVLFVIFLGGIVGGAIGLLATPANLLLCITLGTALAYYEEFFDPFSSLSARKEQGWFIHGLANSLYRRGNTHLLSAQKPRISRSMRRPQWTPKGIWTLILLDDSSSSSRGS